MLTLSDTTFFKDYFTQYSEEWVRDAYGEGEYSYPVGKHRIRVLSGIIEKYDLKGKKALDIGCGAGDAVFLLASKGCKVTGIDMSESMLAKANERKKELSKEIQENIEFRLDNITNHMSINEKYDIIVAFGLVGYLKSDSYFFEIISKMIKNNGILAVSFRNRLFNITSITCNTIKEIENGNAKELIHEINEYYKTGLNKNDIMDFKKRVDKAAKEVSIRIKDDIPDIGACITGETLFDYGMREHQPRQSTPAEIVKIADNYGWRVIQHYGIHPHLLLPKLNKMLPPQVFNILSDTLCAFEGHPIALIWSSVFVSEIQYKG